MSRSPRCCRSERRPHAALPDRRPARRASLLRVPAPPAPPHRPGLPSMDTRCRPPRLPTTAIARPSSTIAAGSAAASSTSSPGRFGPRASTPVRPSCSSCAASLRARRPTHLARGVGHRSEPPVGAPSCHPSAAGAAPFPPHRRCRTRSSKRMSCTRTPARRAFRHPDPLDPPRRRANKRRGHGTFANDRPPIAGVVGRDSGRIRLQVCRHSDRATLEAFVTAHTRRATIVQHR